MLKSVAPKLLKLLSFFPLSIPYRLADIFSLLVSTIPNRIPRLVRKNIRFCFPQLDTKAQDKLFKSNIKHTCYSVFELSALWCWPSEKLLSHIKTENICDAFRHSKKGCILIAPHLGSWEMLNIWLARDRQFMALYKPQADPVLDEFIFAARSRTGAQMLPINASGLRQLSRGLKQGKTTIILPDQRPKKEKAQLLSKFFGHNAPTTTLIQNLCSRIDCDVFLAVVFRERDRCEFSITIEALDHEKLASEPQLSLDYMNQEIENLIKRRPEQYQWGYSRYELSEYRLLE